MVGSGNRSLFLFQNGPFFQGEPSENFQGKKYPKTSLFFRVPKVVPTIVWCLDVLSVVVGVVVVAAKSGIY